MKKLLLSLLFITPSFAEMMYDDATDMFAVYKPNTINLNWWNGNETVAQTTCEYDGTITLPTNPTKPGYTFVGWRLKTNN